MITSVGWYDPNGAMCTGHFFDPRVTPGVVRTVTVHGTHAPRVTVTRIPAVAAYRARQDVRVMFYGSSGRPLAHRLVTYGSDTTCGTGSSLRTTDSAGGIRVRTGRYQQCLFLSNPPRARLGEFTYATLLTKVWITRAERFARVSVGVSSTVLRLGHPVAFTGVIAPARDSTAVLQRITGRTARVVTAVAVRASGRYTIMLRRATSADQGRHLYRVVARGSSPLVATGSATVVVVGR